MSLDLTNSFKTSVDARVKGFVSNVDYMENRRQNFIQKKNSRKRRLSRTNVSFSGFCAVFFLCTDTLHRWWLLKVKKRINKALFLRLNLNSLYYFFIFWFKRLRSADHQQIYCRAEVLHNFFWNHISVWVYSCKFAAYLEDPILKRS